MSERVEFRFASSHEIPLTVEPKGKLRALVNGFRSAAEKNETVDD